MILEIYTMDQKILNISENPNLILINDPIEFFIKEKQEHFWNKRKKDTEHEFRILLKAIILREEYGCEKDRWNTFYRLNFGYGIFGVNGFSSGICSYESSKLDKSTKQLTNDHFFGAVKIGSNIHSELKKCNYDLDYMTDVWLRNNLYSWMTIQVTKDEHKLIPRDKHSFEEKMKMNHYGSVSQLICQTI